KAPALGTAAEAGTAAAAPPANGPAAHITTAHKETVLTPFPDIAEHVMKPPRVWRLLTDGVQFFVGIVQIPRNVLRLAMPWRRASRPAGVFPLAFCRQPIFPVVSEHSGFAVALGE